MNEPMNILLEILEEIKQQNRELKASLTSLPTTATQPSDCNQQAYIEGLGQKLEQQIRHNDEFKEELVSVLTKLGARIHEMKSGIAEVRISQDEATDRLLTELQPKQFSPEVKVTKYYLFDAKRWAEWLVWGIMIAVLGCVIGWASRLYGVNQNLESYALRYRTIRMELGYNEPRIAELDSLFSSENSDDSIRRLRSRITNYELAIQRQAELQLQQRRINEEQEAIHQSLSSE
ncbi:hypothetical protein HQ40_06320 [Porphyromonas gulae]|uniref:hypothetical protein n=1 Tax=Porphyromonas gulae TaxID=111105 RepID=UPI00052DF18E|nr:hypothetical protein [Porphyromonas gulae]KGN75274.1 hypothetical protein HQ40_06320 [Porphyromonas gulae]